MSVSELQKRFDNKTLTGNTSFFVNILYFLWFFFFEQGLLRIVLTWWEMFPLI